jgi:hypothetical protein
MHRISYLIFLCATLVDLILTIALVSLFAYAYLDDFRTALWQNGGIQGRKSGPQQRMYNYADYHESPPMPLIWNERYASCQWLRMQYVYHDLTWLIVQHCAIL